MSFFGGGNNSGPSALTVAKIEAEVMTDMFTKMSKNCFKKCVTSTSSDGDLNVGEMACVDRCVGKYLQTQELVAVVLNNFEQQMKAQEQLKAQQFPKK